jgi:predicted extracellular nuclease
MRRSLKPLWSIWVLLLLVPAATANAALEPFFSEYVEGSGSNQALEIYNATGYPLNLGGYQIEIYFNGSPSAGATLPLNSFTLANGGTYVVVNTQAVPSLMGHANWVWSGLTFDGNDALALRKIADGSLVDVIGQIGFDPGTAWGSGLTSTRDHTLTRKVGICVGRTNGSSAFDPVTEWDGWPVDTFSNLGTHTSNCQPVDIPFDSETWGRVKDLFR